MAKIMNFRCFKVVAILGCTLSWTLFSSNLHSDEDFARPYIIPSIVQKSELSLEAVAQGEEIAAKIWQMDTKIGLSEHQLIKACLFIENISRRSSSRRVYSKKETGLHCTISKERLLNGYLISDLPHGYIGRGVHKTVSKAILYAKEPKILAVCLSDKTGKGELKILRKLPHCRGIVPFLGAVNGSNGKFEIYLESFSEGSLLGKFYQKFSFEPEQLLKIAKDISYGLRAMHHRGLIHRDLHLGNMLLRKGSNGLFEAGLIDFGQSMSVSMAKKKFVAQAPRSKNAPELLIRSNKNMNQYRAEVYALGANLYSLFWGEDLPWGFLYNPYKLGKLSKVQRRKLFRKIVANYTALKKQRVGPLMKSPALSPYEQVQLLIFEMLDYAPSRRPSMREVVKKLEGLVPDL
jgi:serine/threonine protein kinase